MATFSVTNNLALHQIYTGYTGMINSADRKAAVSSRLSQADSTALHRGLQTLSRMDKDDISDKQQGTYFDRVRAFSDAYNNTIESGSSSQNASIAKLTKKIKDLSSHYASELKGCGVSFDDSGYMHLNESTIKGLTGKKYREALGSDSEYNKQLKALAKQITKHVDLAL
ncbi:MAG: hypothetical protein IJT34_02875 [Butyrivibrio sp.]|nr:hypothetical protein [Butyrivibrio sp.]